MSGSCSWAMPMISSPASARALPSGTGSGSKWLDEEADLPFSPLPRRRERGSQKWGATTAPLPSLAAGIQRVEEHLIRAVRLAAPLRPEAVGVNLALV